MTTRQARRSRQAAFWLATVLLIGIFALTWRSTARLLALNQEASRTIEVQYGLQELLAALVDGEAGARGFLVTGREDFLEPYRRGISGLPDLLAALGRLIAEPDQRERLAALAPLVDRKLDLMAGQVAAKRAGEETAARDGLAAGKATMDVIRVMIDRMLAEQERIHADREGRASRGAGIAMATMAAGGAVALLGLGGLFFLMSREMRRREAAERELERTVGALDEGVKARTTELEEANRRLATIIESSPLAVFTVDRETRVLSWNAAAERIYGWTADEVLGRAFPAVPENQREAFLASRSRALAGEPLADCDAERVRKDGTRVRLRYSAAPLREADGRLRGTLYMAEDVTELRSVETQLVQAQKMEAVGQLTGGLAHDFNNQLQVILGSADLLASRDALDPQDRELTKMILSAAERGASLTHKLLAFSRKQTLEPAAIDANEVVGDLEELLRRTLGERVALECALAGDLHQAFADRSQLESAILNLAVNARDAMPQGGRLQVETANVELDEDYAAQRREVTPGPYVMLCVSDTGCGIPRELLERVFEPFFTTKPAGKGTGLGLSMIYGFVKQSKGHVSVYSEVGRGTSVRLYLPSMSGLGDSAAASSPAPAAVAQAPAGAVVLYVEDDHDVRRFGALQLAQLGYKAIETASAEEALAVLSGPGRVDLMFTDVVLGTGMNGKELAQAARRVRPGLKVLFASGYNEAFALDGMLPPGDAMLRKPYRRAELANKLEAMLAPEQAPPGFVANLG